MDILFIFAVVIGFIVIALAGFALLLMVITAVGGFLGEEDPTSYIDEELDKL